LNSALTIELERRKQLADGMFAARLVRDELQLMDTLIERSLDAKKWGAILDPGLPYARGLWAVEHRDGTRPPSAWETRGQDLALTLTIAEWDAVYQPYKEVERTAADFWTDRPDRELDRAAGAFFEHIRTLIPPAVEALQPLAAGERKTRLQRLVSA
jgi:hypothetical protein